MTDGNWAHPELLCDTDWLAQRLDDPGVVVVDCDLLPAYLRLHIPGAVSSLSRYWKRGGTDTDLYGMDDADEFAGMMGRMGVSNDATVVAYDGSGGLYATRLWWTLDRFGFSNFRLLDGGMDKWHAEGRPLSRENVRPQPVTFRAKPVDTRWTCTLSDIPAHIANAQNLFWDVRSDAEWTGANKRGTQRGGRIPGAAHLEWLDVLDRPVRTLKPPDELRRTLSDLGITPDKAVTAY